jgi:predicted GIY-YIG superfamily endonuclease
VTYEPGARVFPSNANGLAYVYELCDPSGVAFYIGVTVSPQSRVDAHFVARTRPGDRLRRGGFMRVVAVFNDYDDALVEESLRIRAARETGKPILNVNPSQLTSRAWARRAARLRREGRAA